MRKKLLCTVAAVAMLSGLFVVAAPPALAAPPTDTQNFHPDDDTSNHSADRLSDRFDGVDTAAHLTNVSTTDTSQVEWRLCPDTTVATDGDETLTQAEFDACTITIGTDTTPTTPAGNPPANVDEAYEFDWNIPGSEDGATRDLVAAACTGAGRDVEDNPSPAADERTCVLDIENDILLEDAQTGTAPAESGEITELCTADVDGPDVGDDPCTVGGPGAGTAAQVDARFQPFEHGDNVPNDGYVYRAMSSDNVTFMNNDLEVADATTDPQHGGDEANNCTLIFTGTNFKEWECEVTAIQVPDDAELYMGIGDHSGTWDGACAGSISSCLLDGHYIVSNERRAESVVATFETDEDLTQEEQCASPDKAETNNLGDTELVLFCVDDQFGQPIDTDITFESSGPSSAGFDGTADCTALNHDNDAAGVDEHCDGLSGTDGIAEVDAENPDDHDPGEPALTGVQNINACVETEPDPLVAAHGCQDEPANLVDDVNKTWESNADEVTLVYGDKSANCRTGPTFRENQVGDEDDLLACVFDFFGNPISTTGEDDGFLEWSIGAGGDDEVDTQFVGTPPPETDAEGEAVARIRAIEPGNDNPTVTLRNDDTGGTIDSDSVSKNVTGVPTDERADSAISIRHRGRPHRFVGRVTSDDDSCEPGRRVAVRRVRPGRDPVIGRDTTNANGRYVVRHRRTNRRFRYYARVGRNADCNGATSPRTPRVR